MVESMAFVEMDAEEKDRKEMGGDEEESHR